MNKNWYYHLKTINHHRFLVMKYCFRAGLYKQGLLHDLSKYSPVEFLAGCKYYQGNRSPNSEQRRVEGLSRSWLHHKGRNKHHIEYWLDYNEDKNDKTKILVGMKIPKKYVVEMFCDRVSACRVYEKDYYEDKNAYEYFMKGRDHALMHPESRDLLLSLLVKLKNEGEDEVFRYIREDVLQNKKKEITTKNPVLQKTHRNP